MNMTQYNPENEITSTFSSNNFYDLYAQHHEKKFFLNILCNAINMKILLTQTIFKSEVGVLSHAANYLIVNLYCNLSEVSAMSK